MLGPCAPVAPGPIAGVGGCFGALLAPAACPHMDAPPPAAAAPPRRGSDSSSASGSDGAPGRPHLGAALAAAAAAPVLLQPQLAQSPASVAGSPEGELRVRQLHAAASAASNLLMVPGAGGLLLQPGGGAAPPAAPGGSSPSLAAMLAGGGGGAVGFPYLAAPQLYGSLGAGAGSPLASAGDGDGAEPPLAALIGVTATSLDRLFTAGCRSEYDAPVWMVVNLQGKIKGSYTCDKMAEFCKRGTLSARQMVLGIDRDLPYMLRQARVSCHAG